MKKKAVKKLSVKKNVKAVASAPSYLKLVKANEKKLDDVGLDKAAADVARLLDNPIFAMTAKNRDECGVPEGRQRAFDVLCAMLTRAGVDLPPLEIELVKAFLPTKPEKDDKRYSANAVDHVKRVCADKLSVAAEILPLAKALGVFTCTSPGGEIDGNGLTALINLRLMEKGLEPFRPDYAGMQLETATECLVPVRPVRVVIVDDARDDLLRTALALAGWPRVETVLYRHDDDSGVSIKTTAKRVAALKPDVILMDEGLGLDFSGHDLVPVIHDLVPHAQFVANTGGSPDKLNAVGAMGNCRKGQSLREVDAAIIKCC